MSAEIRTRGASASNDLLPGLRESSTRIGDIQDFLSYSAVLNKIQSIALERGIGKSYRYTRDRVESNKNRRYN